VGKRAVTLAEWLLLPAELPVLPDGGSRISHVNIQLRISRGRVRKLPTGALVWQLFLESTNLGDSWVKNHLCPLINGRYA
jgi:hypothetical protein